MTSSSFLSSPRSSQQKLAWESATRKPSALRRSSTEIRSATVRVTRPGLDFLSANLGNVAAKADAMAEAPAFFAEQLAVKR